MKHSKWTSQQIGKLIAEAQSAHNKSAVFLRFARNMGLKANSVRNFYYGKTCRNHVYSDIKKFEKFTKLEIQQFLRTIILGYSRGESVRSICMKLAKNDTKKMLRYQNKYRSILTNDRALITKTLNDLENEGYFVKEPQISPRHYINLNTTPKSPDKNFPPRGGAPKTQSNTQPVDNIIAMPTPDYNNLTDQDITNLFMGLVRLVRKQGQSQIDKLKNEIERLKSTKSHGDVRGS